MLVGLVVLNHAPYQNFKLINAIKVRYIYGCTWTVIELLYGCRERSDWIMADTLSNFTLGHHYNKANLLVTDFDESDILVCLNRDVVFLWIKYEAVVQAGGYCPNPGINFLG
jgi:hypothetical protein